MIDIQAVLSGNRLALSRLLSQIENDTQQGQEALAELFPNSGNAYLIGVTGAPGTGKSSLVNQVAYSYRHPSNGSHPRKVAVVAVDPSSPFSGGAVLGDRIRMGALTGDPGVFIRSMASRGSLGGLAKTTAGVVQALDAAGFEIILIETVGAGQAEVDIARLAYTTIVIEAPGLGDDIQAIKAGILEIADILVVNKADRPGLEQTERALRNMLQLAHPGRRIFQHEGSTLFSEDNGADEPIWLPPIQRTIATEATGVPELIEKITDHRSHLEQTGDLRRRERARLAAELDLLVETELMRTFRSGLAEGRYADVLDQIVGRSLSPQQAASELIREVKA
ncbi:MAG: methylmalonyl Co-A mutase-associated GTPase MeaB [Anaerolineales bacterium]|jgi:LAO/AO transport system kinase